MPSDKYRAFSWCDIFRHKDGDIYFMVADLLVGSLIEVEAVKTSSSGGVEGHIENSRMYHLERRRNLRFSDNVVMEG
jgi:hypothetical protein